MGRPFINEVGNVYGRLSVVERVISENKNDGALFRCECSCGNTEYIVRGGDLRKGNVNSCGCYKSELVTKNNTTHGMKGTRIYHIHHNLIARCTKPNHRDYINYGARGIDVCDEWVGKNGFINFHKWSIINGYSDNLSIDRIDNDKGYFPNNCRWTSSDVQNNNKRNNRFYELNGETKSIAQWSNYYNINYDNLINRLNKGLTLKEALIDMEVNINE